MSTVGQAAHFVGGKGVTELGQGGQRSVTSERPALTRGPPILTQAQISSLGGRDQSSFGGGEATPGLSVEGPIKSCPQGRHLFRPRCGVNIPPSGRGAHLVRSLGTSAVSGLDAASTLPTRIISPTLIPTTRFPLPHVVPLLVLFYQVHYEYE